MRRLTFTGPDGEDHELAATFDASMEIAEKVADPLFIAREAAVSEHLGPMYQAKFAFTAKNVPQIIFTGFKAAGSAKTLKDVQAMVFDMGYLPAREVAERYIALIINPKSEEIGKVEIEGKKAAEPGE